MTSVIDDALNYEKLVHSHGQYQLTRVIQQTGGQTVPVTSSGGNDSIFEIPAKVWNLSKSVVSFNLSPDTVGAAFIWANIDGFSCIRQMQLYTRSGLYLCDINDFDRYTNMTLRRENLVNDVIGWDSPGSGLVQATATGTFEGLSPSSDVVANPPAVTARLDGTALSSNLESRYAIPGATTTVNSPAINYRLYLDKIKNSILAENKDLYFNGEILYLRIVWGLPNRVFFTSASGTTPVAGAAYANGMTVQNLIFYLAVETNVMVENMIKSLVNRPDGLQVLIPMVYYNKLSISAATNQNITTRYNRAHGIKLKKIYWSAFNTLEKTITAYDKNNIAGAKVSQFYTMIDNIRTSQYDYLPANLDDWIVKRKSLRGSDILNSSEYYFNWVWVEDFTDLNPLYKKAMELRDNFIEGIDLTNEIKYDIYSTTANVPLNHYIYAVTEKLLIIGSSGISVM
jgi:hypothetical protein